MLTELPLFASVKSPLLEKLEQEAERRSALRGAVLFAEGDPGIEFFVIISGSVDIIRQGEKLAHLGANEFFGEMALITADLRSATALVTEDAELLVISRDLFTQIFGHDPSLSYEVSRAITKRMSANELLAK